MPVTTNDAIERVRLSTRPSREIKSARDGLVVPVEVSEEGDELVPLDEHACRVADQQLADGLVGGIVGAVADRRRLLRLVPEIETDIDLGGAPKARVCRSRVFQVFQVP
jgi:hypothetical protein